MTLYRFICPAPCSRAISVEASNEEDAVREFLNAGAMSCRNADVQRPCGEGHPQISPLTQEQLSEVVRVIMTEEERPQAALGGMPRPA